MNEYGSQQPEQNITTIEKLPTLKDGYARMVHITTRQIAEKIKTGGLDYSRQGMISSTARYWGEEAKCEYWSDDPRFSFDSAVAVVLDVPIKELRMHNNPTISPGIIPAEYFVGIVEAKKPQQK